MSNRNTKIVCALTILILSASVLSPCCASTFQAPVSKVDTSAQPGESTGNSDSGSSPNQVLSNASLNVSDQLDLVTTSIFNGGVKLTDKGTFSPNVFISSTLAASKPSSGTTATKYQDAEMLLPQGGVLNLLFSYSSVNYATQADIASKVTTGGSLGREQLSDRVYLFGLNKSAMEDIAPKLNIEPYISDGFGGRMLSRNGNTTQTNSSGTSSSSNSASTSNVSNYGVGALAYLGVGVDGAFIAANGTNPAGNYRLEATIAASWTDQTTLKQLYPNAVDPKSTNVSVGVNFQVVITSKLNVNLSGGWPIGSSDKFIGRMLIAGVTVSR